MKSTRNGQTDAGRPGGNENPAMPSHIASLFRARDLTRSRNHAIDHL